MAGVVGFVGLDRLSLDMAALLLRAGYRVQAFEVQKLLMGEFLKLGGTECISLMETGKGVAALIVLISHADQINDVIFGHDDALKGLQKDKVIILHSTILPSYIQNLEKKLREDGLATSVVDAYVYKATSDNLNGKVVVMSSGRSDAISKARPFLSAMCEKLYIFEGETGAGSKIKLVTELLEGIHLMAAVEAISLGVHAGIHPWIIYDIISNAAGNSWVFKNYIPQLLRGSVKCHFLNPFILNLGIVLDMAKSLTFPLPLLATAHQQLVLGSSHGNGDDNTPLVQIWDQVYGVNTADAANTELYSPEQLASQIIAKSKTVNRVGFIGLGAMGFGMATHLVKSNFCVLGYDVYRPTLIRFESAGGLIGTSPADVSKDVDVLVVMVTNEAQAESVLYGDLGAVSALPSGASIILSSTVSPAFVSQLERRLQNEGKDLKLVDAPVSGGVKRASMGELTIMAAGSDDALKSSGLVLSALSEKLYVIKGGCGAGSGVKMVNQLLAGVHIAASAEAMAFGARLGLNTRVLFDIITNSGATSWMFENRVPHMLDNDYTPYSALDIFVKDLGIVARECSTRKVPLHISTMAHQLFLAGSAAGWGRQDDAGVVKVYETLTGVKVEGKLPALKKEVVLQSIPPEWPVDPINDIHRLNQKNSKTLVVLDDDPTGTQTVHDVEVLTEWSVESLVEQFRKKPICFFILTNSRSLSSEKATALIKDICSSLLTAAKSVGNIDYTVVLRGDSTLRGHFPEEPDAAVSVIGQVDAWILCPFFLQGGRYTIEDIHYVADSDWLVPAGDTEFAKDAAFGYKSSNLREWVEEKTAGRIPASSVASISIQLLRQGGPDAVCEHLCSLEKGSTCIVNAVSERDMAVFAAGMIQAELKGKSFLCRSAASFVSARIGIIPKARILPKDLGKKKERSGGLIVVGSYVPKTTKQQVEELQSQYGHMLKSIEVSVHKVAMKSLEEREEEINRTAEMASVFLAAHKDTLIMSSRELITGKTASESLEINFKVSSALVEVVRRITTRPCYILAKGGITSSDLATKALEAKRAKVVGQALAGIPLWELGSESRHPGVPYIVFPGNVGDSKALAEVVRSWAHPLRLSSTKEILLNAESGGYAVGAFNVYNMEGVEAVVAAAEQERSPAILQVHPGAFKQGGITLVACCISAAEQASVPITVHFDHGTSKKELLDSLELGFDSIMADGSHLPFKDNISYTKHISNLAHSKDMLVEAELGRLSGTEDDLTVEDYEARLTDVNQAQEFIDETGIDALAVCIGNVHGKYPASGPNLKLDLLEDLYALSSKKGVFLVLHGASGLSKELVKGCIERGVRKFNVNTEVRKAYMDSLRNPKGDLVHVMASAKEAMKAVIAEKMHLFGSAGKA
ncbi:Ketose-bisphosphate aldolase class-II family protein isoform 2 [Theobroma cacao]|uniref:Ketose-bisphosphate aldolase class-II family protein isoform 2 n=2 Tax=Theobroma cacao TaxID=3641 RepID=A0A061FWB0_THECC|nr:Ketose-bisphosphate aldolase class-II family protein isoform 2 [Theobroma cacao]